MKISYVMIVLNGMPFIEYSLKSIYNFAHEIIIIEGAVEKCMFNANLDGSSNDGTVECIRLFPDPDNKIHLIQGKWPEKCEMQNEALKYISGDYVWLVDSDEIYREEEIQKITKMLEQDETITQINFFDYSFWKGFDYYIYHPCFLTKPYSKKRLFKYVSGAKFITHRPPTMLWPSETVSTEEKHLINAFQIMEKGIRFCHYSYVTKKQVQQKVILYKKYGWGKVWNIDLDKWYQDCFLKWSPENRDKIDSKYPIWTAGGKDSCTRLFTGTHPDVMENFETR